MVVFVCPPLRHFSMSFCYDASHVICCLPAFRELVNSFRILFVRASDQEICKREILKGGGAGAIGVKGLLRFFLHGTPPPVVGVGNLCAA